MGVVVIQKRIQENRKICSEILGSNVVRKSRRRQNNDRMKEDAFKPNFVMYTAKPRIPPPCHDFTKSPSNPTDVEPKRDSF